MSSNDEKFVIKIENRQPINHPLTYNNFLLLFPGCTVQENPSNDVIGSYGYEVFIHTPPPTPSIFQHPAVVNGYIHQNDVWTQEWILPPFTVEEIRVRTDLEWELLRRKRTLYLRLTDWTQLLDTPLTEQLRTDWGTYRQQLRDLPSITTDPFTPVWPTPPSPVEFPKPVGLELLKPYL